MSITVPASKLSIGYWAIRGLGAPLRMMCCYKAIDYKDELYEVSSRMEMKEMKGLGMSALK